jgi:ankyrin repeat protein
MIDILKLNETPLHAACATGCSDTVHMLLNGNADIRSKNEVSYAVTMFMRVGYCYLYLKNIKFDDTPLHSACRNGNMEGVKALLKWILSDESCRFIDPRCIAKLRENHGENKRTRMLVSGEILNARNKVYNLSKNWRRIL